MDRTLAAHDRPRRRGARHLGRWLIGAAIAGQFAHLVVVVGACLAALVAGRGNPDGHLPMSIPELLIHFAIGSLLVAIALPLLVRHAQSSDRLDERARRRWLVILALWGPVTMPFYWWRFMRPGAAAAQPEAA